MMQLKVTPPNGGAVLTFWAPLSFKLDDVERYSWGGGTVEILRVAV
jgi:hypothetical protein